MGPPGSDVADVVQETFLAAARSAATFDPGRGPLRVWLWGIARRHVALHYRKKALHHRLLLARGAAADGRPDAADPLLARRWPPSSASRWPSCRPSTRRC